MLDAIGDKLEAAIAQDEESPRALQLAGLDRSGPLAEKALLRLEAAIRKRRRVRIAYSSLSGGDTSWREVDPYRAFQRSEAWYLAGHCHRNGEPRIFRLDRIEEIEETGERFDEPEGFDLEAYLEGSWGAFRGDGDFEIELLFEPRLKPLVLKAQHLPDEEKAVLDDGRVRYSARLNSLEEVARWIVGLGGGVRVVAPVELGELVRTIARASLDAQGE